MKYIRTKDGIYESEKVSCDDKYVYKYEVRPIWCVNQDQEEIISQADTIEELCDEFVLVAPYRFRKPKTATELDKDFDEMRYFYTDKDDTIYGAIWTDKGLIYVAKMNAEGELELL